MSYTEHLSSIHIGFRCVLGLLMVAMWVN